MPKGVVPAPTMHRELSGLLLSPATFLAFSLPSARTRPTPGNLDLGEIGEDL
jgi:hypothetical protein